KFLWLFSKEANTALIYLFLAIVMATALFMTTSRGGIMSFLGALAVLYFACVITAQAKIRNRILLSTVLVLILAVIMIAWVGPEETINRFEALRIMIDTFIRERAILNEIRPDMWRDTLDLIKAFPWTGCGLGCYEFIFPKFRTFPDSWGFLQFGHNDYLHFIAEMGAVGAVFLAGFLLWFIRRFVGCLRRLIAK
ncbi:MAG: O-antigen ligase family protein, partial [Candidatus Omnitrophica bacterium]|nr:O-antigen ligase family protein [Candidatus Omnitrophota bacterium]